jgi:hypothetical protein
MEDVYKLKLERGDGNAIVAAAGGKVKADGDKVEIHPKEKHENIVKKP